METQNQKKIWDFSSIRISLMAKTQDYFKNVYNGNTADAAGGVVVLPVWAGTHVHRRLVDAPVPWGETKSRQRHAAGSAVASRQRARNALLAIVEEGCLAYTISGARAGSEQRGRGIGALRARSLVRSLEVPPRGVRVETDLARDGRASSAPMA